MSGITTISETLIVVVVEVNGSVYRNCSSFPLIVSEQAVTDAIHGRLFATLD